MSSTAKSSSMLKVQIVEQLLDTLGISLLLLQVLQAFIQKGRWSKFYNHGNLRDLHESPTRSKSTRYYSRVNVSVQCINGCDSFAFFA